MTLLPYTVFEAVVTEEVTTESHGDDNDDTGVVGVNAAQTAMNTGNFYLSIDDSLWPIHSRHVYTLISREFHCSGVTPIITFDQFEDKIEALLCRNYV